MCNEKCALKVKWPLRSTEKQNDLMVFISVAPVNCRANNSNGATHI